MYLYFRAGQTILPVSLLPPPGTITIEESSAVGTVVGVRTLHMLTHHISYLITIDHISTRS